MAKRRGLLQHAVKAVKQQQKTAKTGPGAKSTPASKPGARPGSGPPAAKKQKTANNKSNNNHHQQQNQKPTIPFSPADPILLVGEGDLSFAASIITHHHCTKVTATVLEKNLAELQSKYPHVSSNIAAIEKCPTNRLLYGIDARKLPAFTTKSPSSKTPANHHDIPITSPTGAMKRIIFNFPHTGGKSTDVNRQVRHNQELLVDFFRRAQLSLAPGGTIIVTLFEGEPYTLWNIRDLARHAGLQVERSFRFVAGVYPGYAHARTLGVVRNRKGEVARGAWRGEEREARSFVFVRKGESSEGVGGNGRGRKRRRGGESDDDEESSQEGESEVEEGWGVEDEDGDGDEDGNGDEDDGGDGDEGNEDKLKDGGDGGNEEIDSAEDETGETDGSQDGD